MKNKNLWILAVLMVIALGLSVYQKSKPEIPEVIEIVEKENPDTEIRAQSAGTLILKADAGTEAGDVWAYALTKEESGEGWTFECVNGFECGK